MWKCQNADCAIYIPDMRGAPMAASLCPNCNNLLLYKYKGPFGYYNRCLNCNALTKA